MAVTILVGAQWGDEGKGKIIDALAPSIEAVVRFQGGPNAGHTVIAEGKKIVLHQTPTGILHPGVLCAIAPGVLLDPAALVEELDGLRKSGHEVERLKISPACHLILPWHRRLDAAREDAMARLRGEELSIGTTRRGLGPCAMDKAGRQGVRLGDLMDLPRFHQRIEEELPRVNAELKALDAETFQMEELLTWAEHPRKSLSPHVADVRPLLQAIHAEGGRVLMEGAQGTLLDIDWGTYPFVTSTSPIAGGACTGGGLSVTAVDQVIGIFKAYTTRVGNGPFPTEFAEGAFADSFRKQAGEFGATTGRPRRCGWLDLVAALYATELNGLTDVVITKLDVLDDMPEVKICTAYRIDGKEYEVMPEDLRLLEGTVEPVLESFPGWSGSSTAKTFADLPEACQSYVMMLQERLGVKIRFVSNGPDREQLIRCD
jgi:adenylosuccinate synthase